MRIPVKEGSVEGRRIIDLGKGPWQIIKGRGEIVVHNAGLTRATVLDANGMPIAEMPVVKDGNGVKVALPEKALYMCLGR